MDSFIVPHSGREGNDGKWEWWWQPVLCGAGQSGDEDAHAIGRRRSLAGADFSGCATYASSGLRGRDARGVLGEVLRVEFRAQSARRTEMSAKGRRYSVAGVPKCAG